MRFSNGELAAIVLLVCALLAVGAFYVLSGVVKTYSWSSADGDRVSVTGMLLSKETTYKGGHVLLHLKADTGPVDVFVPASSDASAAANASLPGSTIEAIGKVQTYKGQKEIVAESVKEI